jgi:uncharacterized protein
VGANTVEGRLKQGGQAAAIPRFIGRHVSARRVVAFVPIAGMAFMIGLMVARAYDTKRHSTATEKVTSSEVVLVVPARAVEFAEAPAASGVDSEAEQRAQSPAPAAPSLAAPAPSNAPPVQSVAPPVTQLATAPPPPDVPPVPQPEIAAPAAAPSPPPAAPTKMMVASAATSGNWEPLPLPPPEKPALAGARPSPTEKNANLTRTAAEPPQRKPWRLYAQPFDLNDERPRIALVVAGVDDDMEAEIQNLPAAVTLALDPYARRLPEWIEMARAKGHEVLLTLSMPESARSRDTGPMAILSSLDPKENLERLDWALGRAQGFIGVLDIVGNRPAEEFRPILTTLERRGLMLVGGEAPAVPLTNLALATGDVVLSPDVPREDSEKMLAALEDKAKHGGHALGIGLVTPPILRRISAWLAALEKKSFVLVPASAFAAAKQTGTSTAARE